MKSAHDYWNAAAPVFTGDLVRALGRVGLHTHRHKVGFFLEWNGLHPVVVKLHLHIARCEARQRCGGQRFHLPRPNVVPFAAPAADAGMDDREPHA